MSTIMSSLASSQASVTSTAPARSDDPAWTHGVIDPTNWNHIICLYCNGFIKGGGITRLKERLGGVPGEIAACKKVTPNVK